LKETLRLDRPRLTIRLETTQVNPSAALKVSCATELHSSDSELVIWEQTQWKKQTGLVLYPGAETFIKYLLMGLLG
jgi:hypothetical protein